MSEPRKRRWSRNEESGEVEDLRLRLKNRSYTPFDEWSSGQDMYEDSLYNFNPQTHESRRNGRRRKIRRDKEFSRHYKPNRPDPVNFMPALAESNSGLRHNEDSLADRDMVNPWDQKLTVSGERDREVVEVPLLGKTPKTPLVRIFYV